MEKMKMADLVPGLLICLMAVQTSQHEGNKTRTTTNFPASAIPRTFRGLSIKPNLSNQLPAQDQAIVDPHLHVNPEDAVMAYASGILSTRVIPLSYILAMLIGIPSNAYILAFLRVRLRSKSLSTVLLYLNLALSDLLLLLTLALRVHYHVSGNTWIFGEVSCRLITALFYGNIYSSAQTIACISLKRYLAVAKPFLYKRMEKTKLAVSACLLVWFLFGAAITPELLVQQSYHIPKLGITTCHDVLPLEEKSHSPLVPYRLMLVCLGSIIPFLVCIYSHIAVVYHLGQSACDWRPFIRVSTLVFFIFVVCFLPSGILHFMHYFRLLSSGDDRLYGYYRGVVCLCCFHSCLDPFLCLLVSKTASSDLQFISFRGTPQRTAVMT